MVLLDRAFICELLYVRINYFK